MIVSFLAWNYYQYKELTIIQNIEGLRPAVVALITGRGYDILLAIGGTGIFVEYNAINYIAALLFAADGSYSESENLTVLCHIGSGVVGGALYLLIDKRPNELTRFT